jgi:hypothetical protein
MELDFDEFKPGGIHKKHAVTTGNYLKTEEMKKPCVKMAGRRNFRLHTDV